MAVTIQPSDIVAAVRLGDTAEELAEVTRILAYATDAVVVYVPNAPDTAHNEAVRRLVGYLFDMPEAARGDAYANAMRNSGAQRMLLPYRRHRAGYADSDAVADAQSAVGTAGNPVVDVRIDGTHLVITFADGTHDTEELPSSGGGVDGVARTAAAAAQTAAEAAQALANQNEAFKLELPDLVPGVGIALTPSGSRELTISTTGSISGPEELAGGQWEWTTLSLQDPGDVRYHGLVVLGQVDTWTFAASGTYFGAQAQMVPLQVGDFIEIRQSTSRYQTIELSREVEISSNIVTVNGYADRAHHSEIPQGFQAVTITIMPGPLQGVDKVARRAVEVVQENLDDHEGSTHNTDATARLAAQGAHILAGQVETDLNLHEHNHPLTNAPSGVDAAPVLIGSVTVPAGTTPFTIRLSDAQADAFYAAYNAGTYPSGYRIDVQWVSGTNHHALTANLSASLWATMLDGQTYQYHIDAGAALDSTSTRIVNFSRGATDYVEFQTLPVSDDLASGAVFSVWGLS